MSEFAFHLRTTDDCSGGRGLAPIPAAALAQGVGATPMDHYVIWNGGRHEGRAGSLCSRALALITEAWTPIPLRELVLRAARLEGEAGFRPEAVRNAVRQHQRARGAAYLLVRKTAAGDFVAVTDVPLPATQSGSLAAGALVMNRGGERFGRAAA